MSTPDYAALVDVWIARAGVLKRDGDTHATLAQDAERSDDYITARLESTLASLCYREASTLVACATELRALIRGAK